MRFAFIEAEKATWPIRVLCRVLDVSTAGYYAWRKRPESVRAREDRRLGVLVRASHAISRSTYGSPRVHRDLRNKGVRVSRKRVVRLMRENGLRGRTRRRFVTTTDSAHGRPFAPNLLDRDFTATKPNQRWVADVTYLRTPDGFVYLASVLDLFSRYIVGWATSTENDRQVILRALEMAVLRRGPEEGLLHHSDRGSPYASWDYQGELERLGIKCSMSRRGNCHDNAVMESWYSTLKIELGEDFESSDHANRELFDYIETFYNTERIHSTLDYVSPREFERVHAARSSA